LATFFIIIFLNRYSERFINLKQNACFLLENLPKGGSCKFDVDHLHEKNLIDKNIMDKNLMNKV